MWREILSLSYERCPQLSFNCLIIASVFKQYASTYQLIFLLFFSIFFIWTSINLNLYRVSVQNALIPSATSLFLCYCCCSLTLISWRASIFSWMSCSSIFRKAFSSSCCLITSCNYAIIALFLLPTNISLKIVEITRHIVSLIIGPSYLFQAISFPCSFSFVYFDYPALFY